MGDEYAPWDPESRWYGAPTGPLPEPSRPISRWTLDAREARRRFLADERRRTERKLYPGYAPLFDLEAADELDSVVHFWVYELRRRDVPTYVGMTGNPRKRYGLISWLWLIAGPLTRAEALELEAKRIAELEAAGVKLLNINKPPNNAKGPP